jgi:transcriptional regulator with XRE-family HTH domain
MIQIETMTGEELKRFYTTKGYSQKAFAAELGYEPRQLRRWENGEWTIPRHILFAIKGLETVHENVKK